MMSLHYLIQSIEKIDLNNNITVVPTRWILNDVGHLEEKWAKDYKKLRADFYKLRSYYDQNKKCQCHIDECVHFDEVLEKVLDKRTKQLCQEVIDIGFREYRKIMKVRF